MATSEETKQQFINTVRQGTHVLVTVKNDPTVDQLASCIALTVLLNELGKRATAVFSGKVPATIDFLKPGNMLQSNTDSLRDFIISLDKDKADKLRYKVEDTMVKVYITPYQTSLSEKDVVYSKGDFNVDLVIAMGAHTQTDLDRAVSAHGRILHDATVITMDTAGGKTSDLGSINWVDTEVSSLAEMIARAIDGLIADKPDALDAQVATALLAGIVAETESFGNSKTTPATMEVAARLLQSGANQQLVATRLSGPLKAPAPAQSAAKPEELEKQQPQSQTQSQHQQGSNRKRGDRGRRDKPAHVAASAPEVASAPDAPLAAVVPASLADDAPAPDEAPPLLDLGPLPGADPGEPTEIDLNAPVDTPAPAPATDAPKKANNPEDGPESKDAPVIDLPTPPVIELPEPPAPAAATPALPQDPPSPAAQETMDQLGIIDPASIGAPSTASAQAEQPAFAAPPAGFDAGSPQPRV